ncbi:hypothetical protein [Paenibacillus sp. MBLB4367]|uniref:hypothetical protein n=1 Tax=Paenibacillus sp. MBLB4367 TaxID=3384767 RepID=UPI003907EB34
MKIILLSIMILTANISPKMPLLRGEDVTSMEIVRNMPGEQGHMYINADESGKATISKVMGWINASEPVDGLAEFGKRTILLKVRMNDRRLITVSQAYKWVHGTLVDGRGYSQAFPIKGEIVIRNGSNLIRTKSTELYDWLK